MGFQELGLRQNVFVVAYSLSWEKINNLRYADDTTLIAESEEELKSLLLKVKETCGLTPDSSWGKLKKACSQKT